MAETGILTCGLIGFGALARRVVAAFSPDEVRWLAFDHAINKLSLPEGVAGVGDFDALLSARPAIIVEAASQQAVAEYVPPTLERGIPVVLASTGALSDPDTAAKLQAARSNSGTRLAIPSGSIGGLDYLEAIALLPDVSVRYTSRKPIAAWTAELAELGITSPSSEVVLFEGTPEEAAQLYPRNLNAAFAIALAIKPAQLTVRVVADPQAQGNTHEIDSTSAAGEASFRFVNAALPENPKTSMVTALSLVSTVRRLIDETRVG